MAGIERIISSAFPLYLWERGIKGVRARMASLVALSSLVSFLLSLACSGSSFNFEGKWSGKRSLPNNEKGENPILNTIAKVDLDLKPSGRFTLLEGGIPKEGTYRTEAKKAFLKVDTFMDRPIEDQGKVAVDMNKEIELVAQPDGSLLFNDPAGLDPQIVRLERQKQDSQPPR
jgi:hypothetical protein